MFFHFSIKNKQTQKLLSNKTNKTDNSNKIQQVLNTTTL